MKQVSSMNQAVRSAHIEVEERKIVEQQEIRIKMLQISKVTVTHELSIKNTVK